MKITIQTEQKKVSAADGGGAEGFGVLCDLLAHAGEWTGPVPVAQRACNSMRTWSMKTASWRRWSMETLLE